MTMPEAKTPVFPGTNHLMLNAATMIDIVQFWLRNKFVHSDVACPVVTGVEWQSNSRGPEFKITLESKAPL